SWFHTRSLHDALPIFCEKPMGVTLSEMDAMIEAEERSAGQLMIGHNQRFVKEHEVAKEWIASGRLGKIYAFRTTFGHGGPEGWRDRKSTRLNSSHVSI